MGNGQNKQRFTFGEGLINAGQRAGDEPLPSKQRVAGSSPAGRAKIIGRFRAVAVFSIARRTAKRQPNAADRPSEGGPGDGIVRAAEDDSEDSPDSPDSPLGSVSSRVMPGA